MSSCQRFLRGNLITAKCSEDADTFFFMRGFPSLESRGPMKDQFYESDLWKRDLEHRLMPMLEKYDAVLVEADEDLGGWH